LKKLKNYRIGHKSFRHISFILSTDLFQKKQNMKHFTFDLPLSDESIEYSIGQNARENTELVQDSEPQDLWFHAGDGISSCHVVAKLPEDLTICKRELLMIIKRGALLCKENTNKLKSSHQVPFIYAKIEHVHPTRVMGEVQVEHIAKTIYL
jgi:predicted ribosome quality control (RQC) complex YloA/Tae2 family protein